MSARTFLPLRLLLLSTMGLLSARLNAQDATATPPAAEAAPMTLAVASMFSDHMVLQRDMAVPIWGKAAPGAKVTVAVGDESHETTAGDDGRWQLELNSREAGGPHELTVSSGKESLTLADVLIGDVWVASGQSNMEWPVSASNDAAAQISKADQPMIRFIDVPNQVGDKPRDAFDSPGWQACTPQNIGGFSAVAYFFARNLQDHLKVPIGLVGCNWGGTPMEAWTSSEALQSSATFAPMVAAADTPPANEEEAKARAAGAHNQPAALFNGMLSTVIPYGIRGAIWYQGESNAGRHAQYAELSKLMIADWRNRWGQGDFPFLLVQLAGFEPGGESWPFLREAQSDTLEMPNSGMAVATDIGHPTDIHPRNKQEVGRRLALAARAVAYGEDVVHSGPTYRDLAVEDGKARLSFDNVGGGLRVQLKGFEIAGADGKFVPATAEAVDGQVIVSSDQVPEPTQVRYNWAAYPDGNLTNAEGLPAAPFRSQR